MPKSLLLTVLLFVVSGAVQAAAPARGFLVFPGQGVAHYTVSQGALKLQATAASGRIDEYATAGGRIYRMEKLLGKVSELGPDLKPLRQVTVKSRTGIPYWLGAWDGGLLVLNDNAVLYLDGDLNEVARLPLDPRRHGEITPVLNPTAFVPWQGRGYLLANSGELYVLPLARPESAAPLAAALRPEEEGAAEAFWIAPEAATLNLLVRTSREDYAGALQPGERRTIKEAVVLTRKLGDLTAPPLRRVVHEERIIDQAPTLQDLDPPEKEGVVMERRGRPTRTELIRGLHIGVISRSVPAYAEAFIEQSGGRMALPAVVRLKSGGRYQLTSLSQDREGAFAWFRADGICVCVDGDLQEHVLRLLPEPCRALSELPELRGKYFKSLAY